MNEQQSDRPSPVKTAWPRLALYVVLFAAGAAAVVGGWYLGTRAGTARRPALPSEAPAGKTELVVLSFPFHERLETEARAVPESPDPVTRGGRIVRALLDGPEGEWDRVMAEGTELRSFFIDEDGVAYIDVDRKALNIPRDALAAYLSIQSFYQSLRRNIPEVAAVKFLIDAREVDSLWGHFDAALPWTLVYEER